MSKSRDAQGYYTILGLSPGASLSEIKAAFRRRALELHPDRNKDSDTTASFQRLNHAYTVLSDATTRARYDAELGPTPATAPAPAPVRPIRCSACGKISAQPRYVIFFEVKSAIVVTHQTTIEGIFCPTCAASRAVRATLITWVLGWWSVPSGIIDSTHAIFHNLHGGLQPAEVNFRVAAYQARWFARSGDVRLGRALATRAAHLAAGETSQISATLEGRELLAGTHTLLTAMDDGIPPPKLKNHWSIWRWPFIVQPAIPALLIALLVSHVARNVALEPPPSVQRPDLPTPSSPAPRVVTSAALSARGAAPLTPIGGTTRTGFDRSLNAPNGRGWPASSAYVAGYPTRFVDGHATLAVDNAENTFDVFAKLCRLDGASRVVARVFLVTAGGQFTLTDLTAGRYDLRYRDLTSGSLSRSDPLDLEETPVAGRIYKIRGGTVKTFALAESGFEEDDRLSP